MPLRIYPRSRHRSADNLGDRRGRNAFCIVGASRQRVGDVDGGAVEQADQLGVEPGGAVLAAPQLVVLGIGPARRDGAVDQAHSTLDQVDGRRAATGRRGGRAGRHRPPAARRHQNAYLKSHAWDDYAKWHFGLTVGAKDGTKARYAFVYGDFRRIHRMGLIACSYRAAESRHKEIELTADELLQYLDTKSERRRKR